MAEDPFDTDELRRRVLDAWRQSPARFRADANVEDDLALTGYRDRVVIELAQNAADAASKAAVPGRLVLHLDDGVLTASNCGAPLDAAGVESIAVARASAKLGESGVVGRFGVGFAAVLAVSDEPSIASTSGAVRWSRREALVAASQLPELRDELAGRGDRVPVLRLPFAADGLEPPDLDTTVRLPLRDGDAIEAVRRQLKELEPTLLLALPALAEIVVELDGATRVLRAEHEGATVVLHDDAVASRWRVATASGGLPAELLADRPAEERGDDHWQASWALPIGDDGRLVGLPESVARVVRAPTAVDDPLTLAGVLIASYPLDASRRRVTSGPLADAVTAHAADLLLEAMIELPPGPSLLRLVPTGFPDGALDAALHSAVLQRLGDRAWLPLAAEPDVRQRPREAVVVADPLVDVLREVVPSLLPAGWSQPELFALGVRRPPVAELVEGLAAARQDPGWWHEVYAGLDAAVAPGPDRDALGSLPVPLADGALAIGPRGVAMPTAALSSADLSAIGIRVAHPDAVHPLLAALGAVEGTPHDLLEQPQVQAAVEASYDEDDPEPIATAVLSLLAAAGGRIDDLPWLADLALVDAGGEWRPAGELLLPQGFLASVVADDSDFGVVSGEWVERWGAETLVAAGVLDVPVVVRESDAVGPTHDLDDEPAWWSTLPVDCAVEDFVAVRDLEQVSLDALPELAALMSVPPLRSAVVEPALVTRSDGSRLRVASYTAWWLSSRPVLGGRTPRGLRHPDSDPLLTGLYDVAPAGFDAEFLRALGVLDSLDDADADEVLARLADETRDVGRVQLRHLDRWLAGRRISPPGRVRALRHGHTVVVEADHAVVADAPDLLPLLGDLAVVPVGHLHAAALARGLDVPLASQLADYHVVSSGTVVDDAVVHDALLVADVNGIPREVAWRLVGEALHVDGRRPAAGLGRGRAWRDGEWAQRYRRTEALTDPGLGTMPEDEDDLDDAD